MLEEFICVCLLKLYPFRPNFVVSFSMSFILSGILCTWLFVHKVIIYEKYTLYRTSAIPFLRKSLVFKYSSWFVVFGAWLGEFIYTHRQCPLSDRLFFVRDSRLSKNPIKHKNINLAKALYHPRLALYIH